MVRSRGLTLVTVVTVLHRTGADQSRFPAKRKTSPDCLINLFHFPFIDLKERKTDLIEVIDSFERRLKSRRDNKDRRLTKGLARPGPAAGPFRCTVNRNFNFLTAEEKTREDGPPAHQLLCFSELTFLPIVSFPLQLIFTLKRRREQNAIKKKETKLDCPP